MPGLYSLVATRVDGETLTAAKYNADEQNHIDNQELQKTDDFSASVAQMQTATDPGEVGTESLATDASGELARLRFAIKDAKDALGTTVPQWYSTPGTISGLVSTQGTPNLCPNGDVEDWRAGTSVAPFLFVLSGAGATVARNGTNFKTGTFSASVTRAGTNAILEVDAIARAGGQAHIRSRAYRYSAWVRATVASRVRLRINDGVGSTFSSYHTGGGAFERLSVTRTLDAVATALKIGLSIDTGDTVGQIDSLMLSEGTAEVAFSVRGETSIFRQVITGNDTYGKPSNLISARVIAIGAGGGSGGADSGAGDTAAAGGGGAGSVSESLLLAADIGATETVTIGAGGAAGASGVGAGGAGGDTSFGALVIGKGGSGSAASGLNDVSVGAAGGVAGTGQIAIRGNGGFPGMKVSTVKCFGGGGGMTFLGGAGRTLLNDTVGEAGEANSGSGASGAASDNNADQGGSAGGSGIVIVWETVVI